MVAHYHNFNVDFQHVSGLSSSKPCNESCFHNHVVAVTSSITAPSLSARKILITVFCREHWQWTYYVHSHPEIYVHCWFTELVHKSMSRKCTIRESLGNSSVESNFGISVSHFSANINLCSSDRTPILFICIFVHFFLRTIMGQIIM